MGMITKRHWPLRAVIERRQDFRSTGDYPEGWIEETLDCGHVFRNNIAIRGETLRTSAAKRRCKDCARAKGIR